MSELAEDRDASLEKRTCGRALFTKEGCFGLRENASK